MTKSTASFIAYDLRPAKQTERRGIVEFLNCARSAGFDFSGYRYLGFGGTKFIDFQLMEKFVGFSQYQSVEHDDDIYKRCVFNRPFKDIQVYPGSVSDFLIVDQFEGNSVIWLDYEVTIGSDLLSDLGSVAARARDGDFLFVSISGERPPKLGDGDKPKQVLRSRIPSLRASIDKLKPIDFSDKRFPVTAGRLLIEMCQSCFAKRVGTGKFYPLFKVIYKDSTTMCTIGGVFVKNGSKKLSRLRKSVEKGLPIMCPKARSEFYRIPTFNFTPLERMLLEKSNVSGKSGYTRRLTSLGISEDHLLEYEAVSRFVPKFIETAF